MRSADVPPDRDAHVSPASIARRQTRSGSRARQAGLTVVKLGGAHAYAPELRAWLAALARARGSVVLVPGGGPFADAVRQAQPAMGFDERAAHAMAMMAMAQFGRALMSLEPAIRPAASRAAIRRALEGGFIPAWAPEAMADAAGLRASWDLTSDSLAAWLAGEIGAARLVLVKRGQFETARLDAGALAAQGVVDPLFPRYWSASGVRAWIAPSAEAARFGEESAFAEIVGDGSALCNGSRHGEA